MDIKELQYYWDAMLIELYGTSTKASFMPIRLIKHFRPDLLKNNSVTDEGWDWFNGLDLRRCKDINGHDELRFCMIHARIDDFIGSHSMPLLLALMDKKTDNADILKNIRFFKWFRLNHKKKVSAKNKRKAQAAREVRAKHGSGVRFQLNTRANDKRTEWHIVK